MNISDIANKAADIIEEHGLTKFLLHDSVTGGYCARGAMMAAGTTAPLSNHQLGLIGNGRIRTDVRLADRAFSDFVGTETSWFNNAPERTKEEVVQALRDLAVKHQSDEFNSIGEK